MRGALSLATAAILAASLAAQDATFFRDPKAKDLFTAARIAVTGGPSGLARLRALLLKGRSRIPDSGGTLVDAMVEIRILLPDHYLRLDSGSFGRRLTGYAATVTLNAVEGEAGRTAAGADAAVLQANRSELARLMLGTLTYASEEMPLKLMTRETLVEMPGPADPLGVDVIGEKGFTTRLIVDAKTRMPARLTYWGADRSVLTTTFEDRRNVAGLRLPHHIVTTAGDRVVDEVSLVDVAVNPPLTKATFTK